VDGRNRRRKGRRRDHEGLSDRHRLADLVVDRLRSLGRLAHLQDLTTAVRRCLGRKTRERGNSLATRRCLVRHVVVVGMRDPHLLTPLWPGQTLHLSLVETNLQLRRPDETHSSGFHINGTVFTLNPLLRKELAADTLFSRVDKCTTGLVTAGRTILTRLGGLVDRIIKLGIRWPRNNSTRHSREG